jgi:hypothetical protein
MTKRDKHAWEFVSKFRRKAFGWRSSKLAAGRIKEALSEIKLVSKSNPVLGSEGAVIFIEKLSPALEQVDSSSGSLGSTVNNAIDVLVSPFTQTDGHFFQQGDGTWLIDSTNGALPRTPRFFKAWGQQIV